MADDSVIVPFTFNDSSYSADMSDRIVIENAFITPGDEGYNFPDQF